MVFLTFLMRKANTFLLTKERLRMKIELHVSPTEADLFKISFNMDTGVITTTDNEGLINQEKVDKIKLPSYIKRTINKSLDIWENSK